MFIVDDLGWANVGYNNPANVKTPTADSLASDGITLHRHYTFQWCAPTRAAFMTGRLPYHVLQTTNHVDRGFSMLPAKLKQVGYQTHQIGKWHLGLTNSWMTPVGRGFDSSLGYLQGSEDHYTQVASYADGCKGIDLYRSTGPAYGYNGTYSSFLYTREVDRVVEAHVPANGPLMMYVALQVMHAPNAVPVQYSDIYPSPQYSSDYAVYNGMGYAADHVLRNTTLALKNKGLWDNTLLLYSSDNGGPSGNTVSGKAANNWPLRGGKQTAWEGGVRVAAFVSGGFLPAAVRGSFRDGYIHACDWYPTFIALAGGDPTDENARGVPAVDGVDMWPYLSGNVSASPREEILGASEPNPGRKFGASPWWHGWMIAGDYKLILGLQSYAMWMAPVYPNSTTNHALEVPFECGSGCLFNIQTDPSERVNLAASMPSKLEELQEMFRARNATRFEAPTIPVDPTVCNSYVSAHHGFLGPTAP